MEKRTNIKYENYYYIGMIDANLEQLEYLKAHYRGFKDLYNVLKDTCSLLRIMRDNLERDANGGRYGN